MFPVWGCCEQASCVLYVPLKVDSSHRVCVTSGLPNDAKVFTTWFLQFLLPPAEYEIACHFNPCQNSDSRDFFVFCQSGGKGRYLSVVLIHIFLITNEAE